MEPQRLAVRSRSARTALVAGPAAVGLGLAAHLISGGAAPPASVLAALAALVSLLAAAAARFRAAPWAIGIGSGAIQQALHPLFTALTGPNTPMLPSAGHVHSHSAALPAQDSDGTSLVLDLHLLLVAHVAAALITAVLILAVNRSPHRPRRSARRTVLRTGHRTRSASSVLPLPPTTLAGPEPLRSGSAPTPSVG
ncbi:hypothetical protein GCM10027449_17010 [Sinomonas notoginsengisoli]|uniref:hypothetical protein n=1 Tax=Sinomonas notoginsengisoli TaxID=1457311 RepID=UPI001F18915F|nr:hypothetical protein [Sinomonas notoginsengisoli]